MEASSHGHLMLAPVKSSPFPALAEVSNIALFESYNFSTRTPINDLTNFDTNKEKWLTKISDSEFRIQYKEWIKERFEENYSVESACKKYQKLYQQKELFEKKRGDLIIHFCWFHLSMIKLRVKLFRLGLKNR